MSIAVNSDWNFDSAHIGTLSNLMYTKHWSKKSTVIIENTPFEIIKHNNTNAWRIGRLLNNDLSEKIFDSVLFLEMENSKNIGYKIGVSPLYRAKMVGVAESIRGAYIAKNMYRYLVKTQGYNIIGDTEQFFGARRLWSSLSKDSDIIVDIIDDGGILIETDVQLHHGDDDSDFDLRVWSYAEDKKHIRLILKDIL